MVDNDKNCIHVCVQFTYTQNQREVSAAILNVDRREVLLTEFQDEDHFSNFESLILQTNPQSQDETYQLYIKYPENETEKEKIDDILQSSGVEAVEKYKKDFKEGNFDKEMDKILKSPLSQHVMESSMLKALGAFSCIVLSLKLHEKEHNFNAFSLSQFSPSQFMKLDLAAINALLIFPKINDTNKNIANSGGNGTLVELLDKCKTQIGSRTLKRWLKQPLQDSEQINERLDIVEMFVNREQFSQFMQEEFFKKVADLDKLYAKFYKVTAQIKKHGCNLSDVIKVYQLVKNLKLLATHIQEKQLDSDQDYGKMISEKIFQPLCECLDDFSKLEDMIEQAIDLERAKNANEYQVNPKFSQSLQEINKNITKSRKKIDHLLETAQSDLGIGVKLIESNSDEYLFEAKKKDADTAFRKTNNKKYKTSTVKKATLTFSSNELKAECAELRQLSEEYQSESKEVTERLLSVVATYYPAMEKSSQIIAELDVLCSFSVLASNSSTTYVKPKINDKISSIKLVESKHACLDAVDSNCIANDCLMNRETSRFHIITGPNMGGKSTYIRQVAICSLLAHVGCYVPAEIAEIPMLDAIITRVGASDMQLRGISTFMSEMLEAACMLKIATPKSLIIIDELGRGTSTSEGFGLAWAISEFIVQNMQCYCLFATHFHEMIKMAEEHKGVENYHVTCITNENKLTMQYKVKKGFAERSYGLYVAEILEFPQSILDDAAEKLKELEHFGQDMGSQEDLNNENINTNNNQIMDINELAKNATKEKKERIIQLAQSYSQKLQNTNKQEQIMNELRQQVQNILQS